MLRRIDTLYKEKPTLAELYAEDAQLFSGLSGKIPVEEDGVAFSDFVALALVELGELQTIFPTAATLKTFLGTWGTLHAANWARMQTALDAAYNPIHNYDRTEEESETVTTSSSGTAGGTESSLASQESMEYGTGFNSTPNVVPYTPVRREQTTPSSQTVQSSESETSGEIGRERELNISGNIGVTTSQQMVTAELELRDKFALYYLILDEFRRDICVEVW